MLLVYLVVQIFWLTLYFCFLNGSFCIGTK